MAYAQRLEGCTEEEAEGFLSDLAAPLDPEEARAEQNIGRWLRGG